MPLRPQQTPLTSRRPSRTALAAGLVAALAMTPAAFGAAPAHADEAPAPAADKPLGEKFSTHDATLLAEARAAGEPYVTMMIAAEPDETQAVADQIDSLDGASVGYTEESIGYVRVTVRTGKADAAIAEATGMDAVRAIDLNEEIQIPDPVPESTDAGEASAAREYSGPDADTPAENPYQPAHETGAVDFVEDNPRADGRGVTIGVLDTGVDLAHPALQETTTGKPKITDWVTATDPIIDLDGSWRSMTTAVSGPSFEYRGQTYTAPAGDYLINTFQEISASGEIGGDVNRDGDTTDSFALLYDPEAGTVRVDLAADADFTNDEAMTPYGESHDIGYFGSDDESTEIAEAIPFVVEIREDVPMDPYGGDWVGKTADFVNIGIVSGRHGTHVAGIAAANGLFGGEMDGAAPGAQVVSSRACSFSGGCTYTALTEGMIDLVVNRDVDVVNVSIGGLPALNDGNNARAWLYNELIDTYGVQMFISAGNDGPGTNTVGDPSVADKVVSVGAAISDDTWAANYGSGVERDYAMMPFSSAGPRDDGGFKPTLAAPGASINAIPTWQAGSPVAEAGYDLPPGYGMLQGTSMASPQAAGAAALLLSAANRYDVEADPDSLRTALTSTADPIRGAQAHEQGAGLIDTEAAWRQLTRGADAHEYTVEAPVDHAMDEYLATPGVGSGIYDRESAPALGQSERYDVTITRTTGPDRPVRHSVELENNDERTFRLVGRNSDTVMLPLNEPVTVTVEARPRSAGAHSAVLAVDDHRTGGLDTQILATVVVPDELTEPSFAAANEAEVQRNDTTSYFVDVPEGTETLEVAMSGLAELSQTRWIAITPYGTLAEDSASNLCYPHYNEQGNTCRPDLRSYEDPIPGVWEIEVEARRTSPILDNPYEVTATALGTTFEPETATIDEAQLNTPTPVSWEVTNEFAPIEDGSLSAGELGSALTERPSIAEAEYATRTVELPAGVSEFSAVIGSPADPGADLDLYVYRGEGDEAELVGASSTSASEEAVTLTEPEAGTYTIEVHGYAVPAGSTEYDYRDAYLSAGLGTVAVEDGLISLDTGENTEVGAEVTVTGSAPEGREFFGAVQLLNAAGTPTGTGNIIIERVVE